MSSLAPVSDLSFALLPDKVRQDVLRWQAVMEGLEGAAHGTLGKMMERVAAERGLSVKAVRAKYDGWRKEGWRALCHRRRLKGSSLPGTFIEFWRGLVECHQRERVTVKQAHRALLARLEAWTRAGGARDCEYAIPGYDRPPRRLHATRLPMGWDYNNLLRYAPDKAARALRSRGGKAYSTFVPGVRATREGVAVGQVIFFDDEQPDVMVNLVGRNKEPMRPLGFHALDYVSGCNVMRGWKPQVRNGDGSKSGLTETDFYWFVIGLLTRYGYRADVGTTLVVEMGTAAIRDDFAERLERATGGKVSRDHSGRFGDPAFRGMLYEGQSSGNFRYKAPIESWFNLERNYMSALPGATGRNRDDKPEESYGLIRADKAWLKMLEGLPLERRLLARSPLMEWGAFVRHADWLVDQVINRRVDHELQDWERCGHVVPVLSMGEQEVVVSADRLALMAPEMQGLIHMMVSQGHGRLRRMSPAEVWDAGCGKMSRLAGWQIPALMRPEDGRLVRVTQQFELVVEDQEIDSEPLRYIASVQGQHGLRVSLKRGETYLCFLNPYAPGSLQVCEAGARAGAWIGEAVAVPRVSKLDQSGLHKLWHDVQEATAPERADIERRAAAEIHRRVAEKRWNDRLADKSPLTAGEKQAAQGRAEVLATLADIHGVESLPAGDDAGPGEDVFEGVF